MEERFVESERTLKDSLEIFAKHGDHLGEGEALNNLGTLHRDQDHLSVAEELYQRSLSRRNAVGDTVGEGRTLFEMGILYDKLRRRSDARRCFERCLSIRSNLGDKLGQGQAAKLLAESHYSQGHTAKALHFARLAASLLETTEDDLTLSETRKMLSTLRERTANRIEI